MEIIEFILPFSLGMLVIPMLIMADVPTDTAFEWAFKASIILNILCIFGLVVF